MLRCVWVVFLTLFCCVSGVFCGERYDFQKNGVSYVWERDPSCVESKKVFLDAFVKCYGKIPLDVLDKKSREEMVCWLNDAFDEIYGDYKSSQSALWLSAKADDRIVGFLIIDPAYQRRGVGSSMICSLFDQFSACSKLVVITRRANEEAKAFYHALGFVPSSYMHEGYSDALYTGFEYMKKN